MRRIALIILCLSLVNPVSATSLSLLFTDESARFTYAAEVFGGEYGPADLEFGLLVNEDDDVLLNVGILVRNDTLDNPLVISVGTRAYYADVELGPGQKSVDVAAITIGGELLFIPEGLSGFGFGVYAFYAPSITSFLDADSFTELGIKINYQLTEQADIYIGYHDIEAGLDTSGTVDIDSGAYVGIGIRF